METKSTKAGRASQQPRRADLSSGPPGWAADLHPHDGLGPTRGSEDWSCRLAREASRSEQPPSCPQPPHPRKDL